MRKGERQLRAIMLELKRNQEERLRRTLRVKRWWWKQWGVGKVKSKKGAAEGGELLAWSGMEMEWEGKARKGAKALRAGTMTGEWLRQGWGKEWMGGVVKGIEAHYAMTSSTTYNPEEAGWLGRVLIEATGVEPWGQKDRYGTTLMGYLAAEASRDAGKARAAWTAIGGLIAPRYNLDERMRIDVGGISQGIMSAMRVEDKVGAKPSEILGESRVKKGETNCDYHGLLRGLLLSAEINKW